MYIDSYSFGEMIVDGEKYDKDLLIFPDKVKPGWWRKEVHSLAMEDLREVVDCKPEVLVVGRGALGLMTIPMAVRTMLDQMNIKLVDGKTEEAVHLFNEFTKKGKRVAGAFYLT